MANIDIHLSDDDLDKLADRIAERLASRLCESETSRLLYTESEAAVMLGISHAALKRWRNGGYVKASRQVKPVLYTRDDLETVAEWLCQRK